MSKEKPKIKVVKDSPKDKLKTTKEEYKKRAEQKHKKLNDLTKPKNIAKDLAKKIKYPEAKISKLIEGNNEIKKMLKTLQEKAKSSFAGFKEFLKGIKAPKDLNEKKLSKLYEKISEQLDSIKKNFEIIKKESMSRIKEIAIERKRAEILNNYKKEFKDYLLVACFALEQGFDEKLFKKLLESDEDFMKYKNIGSNEIARMQSTEKLIRDGEKKINSITEQLKLEIRSTIDDVNVVIKDGALDIKVPAAAMPPKNKMELGNLNLGEAGFHMKVGRTSLKKGGFNKKTFVEQNVSNFINNISDKTVYKLTENAKSKLNNKLTKNAIKLFEETLSQNMKNIIIFGYASCDGNYENNYKLAKRIAKTLRKNLCEAYGINNKNIVEIQPRVLGIDGREIKDANDVDKQYKELAKEYSNKFDKDVDKASIRKKILAFNRGQLPPSEIDFFEDKLGRFRGSEISAQNSQKEFNIPVTTSASEKTSIA